MNALPITATPSRALAAFAFASLLFLSSGAWALSDDRTQPIKITAKTVDVNQKTGMSRYNGNVVLIQGSLRIQADRLVVKYRGHNVETVSAFGHPVTFRQKPDGGQAEIIGSASRLEYHADQNKLDLYDQVAVRQGDDVLRSGVLHYDLDNNSISAEAANAGERVQTVIQPTRPVVPAPRKR